MAAVTITLGGDERELEPSAAACRAISEIAGGLDVAVQQCAQLKMETIIAVVSAGLGLNPRMARNLSDDIYAAGVREVAERCVEYIAMLANAGKVPKND